MSFLNSICRTNSRLIYLLVVNSERVMQPPVPNFSFFRHISRARRLHNTEKCVIPKHAAAYNIRIWKQWIQIKGIERIKNTSIFASRAGRKLIVVWTIILSSSRALFSGAPTNFASHRTIVFLFLPVRAMENMLKRVSLAYFQSRKGIQLDVRILHII